MKKDYIIESFTSFISLSRYAFAMKSQKVCNHTIENEKLIQKYVYGFLPQPFFYFTGYRKNTSRRHLYKWIIEF